MLQEGFLYKRKLKVKENVVKSEITLNWTYNFKESFSVEYINLVVIGTT